MSLDGGSQYSADSGSSGEGGEVGVRNGSAAGEEGVSPLPY